MLAAMLFFIALAMAVTAAVFERSATLRILWCILCVGALTGIFIGLSYR